MVMRAVLALVLYFHVALSSGGEDTVASVRSAGVLEANARLLRAQNRQDDDDDDDDDDDLKRQIVTEKKKLATEKTKFKHESNKQTKKAEKKEYKQEKKHVEAMEAEYEKEYNKPDKYAAYRRDGYAGDGSQDGKGPEQESTYQKATDMFSTYKKRIDDKVVTPECQRKEDGCLIKCEMRDRRRLSGQHEAYEKEEAYEQPKHVAYANKALDMMKSYAMTADPICGSHGHCELVEYSPAAARMLTPAMRSWNQVIAASYMDHASTAYHHAHKAASAAGNYDPKKAENTYTAPVNKEGEYSSYSVAKEPYCVCDKKYYTFDPKQVCQARRKSRTVAMLLQFFLGTFGAGCFYLRMFDLAAISLAMIMLSIVLQILFCCCSGGGDDDDDEDDDDGGGGCCDFLSCLCCPCIWFSRFFWVVQFFYWIYTLVHIYNHCESDGVPCF